MGDNLEDFILIKITKEYKEQITSYKQEFINASSSMDGTGQLQDIKDIDLYINFSLEQETPSKVPSHLVPATQFLFIRKSDNKLIGMIQVRHYLNSYLKNYGGHIGYSIRPFERGHGYAKKMLKMTLPFCQKINISKLLITCTTSNLASQKTILANGGVFESTIHDSNNIIDYNRYLIDL